jgi:uncharacterized protein (TIGR03084 family)
VREILSDLVAEQQTLDQFLQKIHIRDWKLSTSDGWDIQDTVSHLAAMEGYAANAVSEGGSRLGEIDDHPDLSSFHQVGVEVGRHMRPQDVIEVWRENRAKVVDALSRMNATDRIPWFRGDMSAKTFATMRMADTWTYAIDIHRAVESEPEDTDRLRHIGWLAWKNLPYVFAQAGEDYPDPIKVHLVGPMYAKWVSGPDDSEQVIKGPAGPFCRKAVDRRLPDDSDDLMTISGDLAARAYELVRITV